MVPLVVLVSGAVEEMFARAGPESVAEVLELGKAYNRNRWSLNRGGYGPNMLLKWKVSGPLRNREKKPRAS